MINFTLDGKPCSGLWDTGSMVCLIDKSWLSINFPDAVLMPLSNFTSKDSNLQLKAANNIEMCLEGVVVFEFSLGKSAHKVLVPFLVTSDNVSSPVIGYNLIKYLVHEGKVTSDIVEAAIPSCIDSGESLINLIKYEVTNDSVGAVVLEKETVVPPNCVAHVVCKLKKM